MDFINRYAWTNKWEYRDHFKIWVIFTWIIFHDYFPILVFFLPNFQTKLYKHYRKLRCKHLFYSLWKRKKWGITRVLTKAGESCERFGGTGLTMNLWHQFTDIIHWTDKYTQEMKVKNPKNEIPRYTLTIYTYRNIRFLTIWKKGNVIFLVDIKNSNSSH